MDRAEKETLLKIARGDVRAGPILFALANLPYNRRGEVFRFMLYFGITGEHLIEVWERNNHSPFKVYKAILDRIDRHMSTPLNMKDLQ